MHCKQTLKLIKFSNRKTSNYRTGPRCNNGRFVKQQAGNGPSQKDSKRLGKPLFLQLETTKALKKLKVEEKIFPNFFSIFLKSPVSCMVPKNVNGGTLWDFLNNHFVDEGNNIKKIGKMRNLNSLTVPKKRGKSHSVEKSGKGDLAASEWLFISC